MPWTFDATRFVMVRPDGTDWAELDRVSDQPLIGFLVNGAIYRPTNPINEIEVDEASRVVTHTPTGVSWVVSNPDDRPEYAEVGAVIRARHGWTIQQTKDFMRSVADVVLAMKAHGRI